MGVKVLRGEKEVKEAFEEAHVSSGHRGQRDNISKVLLARNELLCVSKLKSSVEKMRPKKHLRRFMSADGHSGQKTTREIISQSFYWPEMSNATSTSSSGPSTGCWDSPTVNSQIIKNVKDAWEGKRMRVLESRIGPLKILYKDIFSTAPKRPVTDEVNAYLTLLVKEFNKDGPEKAFPLDSVRMKTIWQHKSPTKTQIDLEVFKYIVGVYNEGHHWMLVVIKPGERRTLFMDPLGEHGEDAALQERDEFAECILDGSPLEFHESPSSFNAIRREIAVCLLENTDWLLCPRWFHRSCAKRPDTEDAKMFLPRMPA
ncbi:uncharacterized protein LOC115577709 [Sparus aurata]|uniref:uncharacterized protein LOC115577709 n=1 Tax=Sparus aurata TaxID=8175 RepID=UPI0011C1BF80|nr:uncharacterized protein LOC115577709 [Sparus aurata]